MKRTLSCLLIAVATLPGCSWLAQDELRKSLTECMALNGKEGSTTMLETVFYSSKAEGAPLQVTLEFEGSAAELKIVNVTHFSIKKSGLGAQEAAQRLKPLANPDDRDFSDLETVKVLYERKDGEWLIRSGSRQKVFSGGTRSVLPTENFDEAELVGGLVNDLGTGNEYGRKCLVDKRLTRSE